MTSTAPPDTRPGALLFAGIRRGFLLVFLPLALAGQALAWVAFAITGAYEPVSWLKIGLAYTLMSARVPFEVTRTDTGGLSGPPMTEVLAVALGAFTIALLVLAFRAGRAQAAGSERAPLRAAWAGGAVGLGVALPMLVAAVPVRVGFPSLDVTAVEPSLVFAVVMPLALAGGAGLAGGLAAARETLEARGTLGAWSVAAARGAAATLTWGLVAATLVFAVVMTLRPAVPAWYVRWAGGAGNAGAATVVHHGLLLPNQMMLAWSVASGAPVELAADDVTLVEVSLEGWDASGIGSEPVPFGAPYLLALAAPIFGAWMGGRLAGAGIVRRRHAIVVGAVAGLAGGLLGVAATWLASIRLPFLLLDDPTTLGPSSYARLVAVAILWGLLGGALGGASRNADASSGPR